MMRVPLLRGLAYARPLRRLARVEVGARMSRSGHGIGAWRSQTGRVLIEAEGGRTAVRPAPLRD